MLPANGRRGAALAALPRAPAGGGGGGFPIHRRRGRRADGKIRGLGTGLRAPVVSSGSAAMLDRLRRGGDRGDFDAGAACRNAENRSARLGADWRGIRIRLVGTGSVVVVSRARRRLRI